MKEDLYNFIFCIVNILLCSFLSLSMIYVFTGYHVFFGYGDSMCPTIQQGSLMLYKEVRYEDDIILGNVYLYRMYYGNARYNVAHRYIDDNSTNKDYLIFKGDNNRFNESVQKNSITDEVIYTFPILKC